ncbi:hypothetical protein [Paenibacillus tyrfis]|nr:hypothetical protein [Paenibacillus tyrfis]
MDIVFASRLKYAKVICSSAVSIRGTVPGGFARNAMPAKLE